MTPPSPSNPPPFDPAKLSWNQRFKTVRQFRVPGIKVPPLLKFFGVKLPRLKLYEQFFIFLLVVVLIPLIGVSVLIYNINQRALKKEITNFTVYTAKAIYQDLETEMSWQKRQTLMLASYAMETFKSTRNLDQTGQAVLKLSNEFDAVGLYDPKGKLLKRFDQSKVNARQAVASQKRLLPEQLEDTLLQTLGQKAPVAESVQYQVVYVDDQPGHPRPQYFLRAIIPTTQLTETTSTAQPQKGKPLPTTQQVGQPVGFLVLQKPFGYLQALLQNNRKQLHDAVYIVDETGLIIAGPSWSVARQDRLTGEDLQLFLGLSEGVTEEFEATSLPTVPEALPSTGKKPSAAEQAASEESSDAEDDSDDEDEESKLESVLVKVPGIRWGIVIESPYHIRQIYIRRARNQTLLVIAIALAGMMGLAFLYLWSIRRNFRQLIKGIQAFAEGNYGRRIRLLLSPFTPYEIVYLGAEFNRMSRQTMVAWQNSKNLNKTLQSANEKLSKLDELKSTLIDTVSHELRTPLTSIKGYTSRLIRYEDSLEPETKRQSLKIIKQQADRLGRLVDDLLVIPDLENSRLRLFPDQVNLVEVLERVTQFIQQKDHKAISVQYETEAGMISTVPPMMLMVLADPDRLEQVLVNLLDNAVKYTDPPEAMIEVLVKYIPHPITHPEMTEQSGFYEIAIRNPCPPIPEAELTTLFEKFKRLDEKLTRTTRGTGLGLFITKELVEAMGGNIYLESLEKSTEAPSLIPVGNTFPQHYFQIRFTLPEYQELALAEAMFS